MVQIKKWNYGNNSSDNYGAHTIAVKIGNLILYFSYDTVVAFEIPGEFVCSKNVWTRTTGKHLNWICPDKSKRVPNEDFEKKLSDVLIKAGLEI